MTTWRGGAVLLLWSLPWLVLIGLGGYWLWLEGWFYYGVGAALFLYALAYALLHWPGEKTAPLLKTLPKTPAAPNWSKQDRAAWDSLEPIRQRGQVEPLRFTDLDALTALSDEILSTLAAHYHQHSRHPALEFPLPQLLHLIQHVARDLEQDMLSIPGSHTLKVSHLIQLRRALSAYDKVNKVVGSTRWLVNWPGAAIGKAKDYVLAKGMDKVKHEIGQRLLNRYIDRLGYYAIQLYGGHITLDARPPDGSLSAQSAVDLNTAQQAPSEPLRILLMGQVSSGKSSLIDALFGKVTTASSRLPTTTDITPYELQKHGELAALILDSPGFGEHTTAGEPRLATEWRQADVILWLVKANQADRAEDVRQIDALRRYFTEQGVNRAPPVIIAVVSHIDQLRPLQHWQPPYNIATPDHAKAATIQAVCVSVSEQLQLPLAQVVPVCLSPARGIYNVADGVSLAIEEHLDAAQRVRYLRCLREQKTVNDFRHLKRQLKKLGQIILD
ncbi:MAG: GTPase [Methylococcales bacterium]|nr:GTPase [Methylococcales bacterium]